LSFLLISSILLGCGDIKDLGGRTYTPYGLCTMEEKDENVVYGVPIGNVVLGLLFFPTLVVPGYIICADLFEPRQLKQQAK
jgi:hypothetical protein